MAEMLWQHIHEIFILLILMLQSPHSSSKSTGWPGIVAVMGNWLGISRRGLVMGIWNSHTSVGNILGTAIPAIWAKGGEPW